MCSSAHHALTEMAAESIHVPSKPTNCAEVVGLQLLSMLRQPECDYDIVSTIWSIYLALRWTTTPTQLKRLLAPLLKDLPREVRRDLAREAWFLTDASSVLMLELLGCGLAQRSQWTCGFPTGSHPDRSPH